MSAKESKALALDRQRAEIDLLHAQRDANSATAAKSQADAANAQLNARKRVIDQVYGTPIGKAAAVGQEASNVIKTVAAPVASAYAAKKISDALKVGGKSTVAVRRALRHGVQAPTSARAATPAALKSMSGLLLPAMLGTGMYDAMRRDIAPLKDKHVPAARKREIIQRWEALQMAL